MPFDPVFVYGNYAEACLWSTMGAIALVKRPSGAAVALGVTLITFGLSDVVETRTGAWYVPWWMLAWKIAGVVLAVAFGLAAARRREKTGGGG